MWGAYSELEFGMIRERVKSGMANAKAKGVRIGRPELTKDDIPAIFYRHYPSYVSGELNVSALIKVCDTKKWIVTFRSVHDLMRIICLA